MLVLNLSPMPQNTEIDLRSPEQRNSHVLVDDILVSLIAMSAEHRYAVLRVTHPDGHTVTIKLDILPSGDDVSADPKDINQRFCHFSLDKTTIFNLESQRLGQTLSVEYKNTVYLGFMGPDDVLIDTLKTRRSREDKIRRVMNDGQYDDFRR